MLRTIKIGSLLLLTAYCSLITVNAQPTGAVKGKVQNMRGERIAGATVTARQNSSDVRSTRANDKGEFTMTGLQPGIYNVVFDAKGYSTGVKYNVEVRSGKTVDLGERLILQVDQGTQVIIKGSVFDRNGRSIPYAKVEIEKLGADGSRRKMGTVEANIYGEFTFRQPEGAARFRLTSKYKDSRASKEIDVDSAAIYRLALNLEIDR